MTIVMQHRFWDLSVGDDAFEVKLTFDGIPERLVIPFDAIRVFVDPSVRFSIQFDDPSTFDQSVEDRQGHRHHSSTRPQRRPTPQHARPLAAVDQTTELPTETPVEPAAITGELKRLKETGTGPGASDDNHHRDLDHEQEATTSNRTISATDRKTSADGKSKAKPKRERQDSEASPTATQSDDHADQDDEAATEGAQILQLDAFRKK